MTEKTAPTADILLQETEGPEGMDPREARKRVEFLSRRIHEKIDDYEEYQFSKQESRALNIFFDLAQENTGKHDLLALSVVVPKVFFDKDADLYLLNADGELEWRCCSDAGCPASGIALEPPAFSAEPRLEGNSYLLPIKGNHELISQLPIKPRRDVIGMLVVRPASDLNEHQRLFFEKYANRIGYRIHNRLISQKNKEHLEFIRNLVDDIGHNVIVPNMYFKLYYKRLESKIKILRDIAEQFQRFTSDCGMDDPKRAEVCNSLKQEMDFTFQSLMDQYQEIHRHYEQTSLFLETLLRRSHFEKGHYVVDLKPVNLRTQVVEPQLERYRGRLEDKGVRIEAGPGTESVRDPMVLADVGLISQVVANFFSNAAKYTRPAPRGADRPGESFVIYDWDEVERVGDREMPAVRFSVLTSGEPLADEEAGQLFTDGFRGRNASQEYGTGHGLSFVREVVGLHRGVAGYEPAPSGNLFFFYLPQPDEGESV